MLDLATVAGRMMGSMNRLMFAARWIALLPAGSLVVASAPFLYGLVVMHVLPGTPVTDAGNGMIMIVGSASAVGWAIIAGQLLVPDLKWLFRRLPTRLRRPSQDVDNLAG